MSLKEKVLLHICCAPDSTAVYERLKEGYEVVGFFHNPNVHPEAEYNRRLANAKIVADKMDFPLVVPDYHADDWLRFIKGYENEPEKGKRCLQCYEFNLQATAQYAKSQGINNFTTTLTISPHKLTGAIFDIGRQAAADHQVEFLAIDFKKKDGFKRSLELSKELDLYRQRYCGCKYSLRVENYA